MKYFFSSHKTPKYNQHLSYKRETLVQEEKVEQPVLPIMKITCILAMEDNELI